MPEDHPQNSSQYIYFSEKFNPYTRGMIYKFVNNSSREIPPFGLFCRLRLTIDSILIESKRGFILRKASFAVRLSFYKELLIVLKVLPIFGPITRTIAITTTATSTRMIAYSTSPCPLSCGWNNMDEFLSE